MIKARTTKSKECPVTDSHERTKDYLGPDEMLALLAGAKQGRHGQRDYMLCLMLYRHGLRVSEALSLKVKDVDFKRARMWIPRLKNGLSVEHPLEGDEVRGLKTLLAGREDGLLFVSERGSQLTRQAVNYLLTVIGNRIGLSVHPHMLRHSCGYYLANRGYDLRLIQDYLGHRSVQHTVRYTRTASVRFEGLWTRK